MFRNSELGAATVTTTVCGSGVSIWVIVLRQEGRAALQVLQPLPRPFHVLGLNWRSIAELGLRVELERELGLIRTRLPACGKQRNKLVVGV